MPFLLSKTPPFRWSGDDFSTCFERNLEEADMVRIASGYISTDALTELKKIIEVNSRPCLELLIGMHHFDGFTRSQFEALTYLNDFLTENDLGKVFVSTVFKFHGKIYSFSKSGSAFSGMIGSSNLTNFLPINYQFEADYLLEDSVRIQEADKVIRDLFSATGTLAGEYRPSAFKEVNSLLENHDRVDRLSADNVSNIYSRRGNKVFQLPLKADDAQRSNLNTYFGRGRVNQRGFEKPRHWYEVELIVSNQITRDPQYPKSENPRDGKVIKVYTDDGWSFNCKTSGDFAKNFRSEDDLRILGKWIKGRLENAGCLTVGEKVTDRMLERYGKKYIDLISTDNPDEWILEFKAGS